MANISKKEIVAIVLFSVSIMYLTTIPYKLAELSTPKGMVFMNVIGPIQDPNSYLAWCKQAKEGKFLFEDKYTTEKQKGIFFHPYFLTVGLLAKILGKNAEGIYEASRLILGFILLLLIYIFSVIYFGTSEDAKNKRIFSFLFASISSGFGWLFPVSIADKLLNLFNFKPIDLWITEGFTLLTILIRPLFSLTQILILSIFLLLYLSHKTRKLIYAILSGICSFLIGFIHPYDLVTIYLTILIYFLFQLKEDKKDIKFILFTSFLPIIFSFPVLFYEYLLFTTDPVFSKWSETTTVSPNPLSFVIGYGVLFVFASLEIQRAYNRKGKLDMLMLSWLLAVSVLLYIPLNFQRRLIMGIQIPLAIFATESMFNLIKFKSTKLIILGLLIISIPSNLRYIEDSIFYVKKNYLSYNIFTEDYNAMKWIDSNIHSDSTILSSFIIGMYLPGKTGNKVYIGHYDQTINLNYKLNIARKYFDGEMNYKEKIKFLKNNGINYIYYGAFERMKSKLILDNENYLTSVYKNDSVKIYRVE